MKGELSLEFVCSAVSSLVSVFISLHFSLKYSCRLIRYEHEYFRFHILCTKFVKRLFSALVSRPLSHIEMNQ